MNLTTPTSSSDNPQTVLELRLEEFVKRFVKEFEAKLTSYSVILDDVLPKCGKYPKSAAEIVGQSVGLALGGAVGLAVGFPELGANTGKAVGRSISRKIEEKVRKNHLQNTVSKLSHFINYFEENESAFRKMLVTVGLDIFQSFEMQFGRVSSDMGERGAMNQLAIDAVNRSLEYIGRTSAETELDYYTLIVEGVKFGRSKSEPVLDVAIIPGRRKGFDITYQHDSKVEMWKTASLYSKVGIVVINKRGRNYYNLKSDKNNKSLKYGFRRLLTYEEWKDVESLYVKSDANEILNQFLSYDYVYTPGMMNERINRICAKLQTERDKKLGIDRVYALIKESKDELLEKLHLLKPMYDKLEEESRVLAKIESDLINLNLEEYFSMFDLKMNHVFDEISKGNFLTHAKLEKISISIEEIKDKVDSMSQAARSSPSRNSIWFDVRNELLTFTGREVVLSQIDVDLNAGPVVISGLGGIGKSELAIKYARSRYSTSDNVIWINADSEESMAGTIWQLAQALNLKHEIMTDINVGIAEIYDVILNQNCLLILDNAKNFSDVEKLLKFSNDVTAPKVIITSRNSSGWNSGRFSIQLIQLEVFDPSEATEFVKRSLSIESDSLLTSDIQKLIDILGNFPLALQLAVTNIKITNSNYAKRNKEFTIAMFLDKFNTQPQKLMCGILPLDIYRQPCSIFIVVGYTFKDLENDVLGAKAQLILKMAAYMAPDNIREEFFLNEFDDKDELMDVMNLLENYSLVKINDGKLTIHRLVQQSIRFVSEKEEELILKKNLNLLMKRLKNWDNIRLYTPHVIAIWDYACNYKSLIEEFIINSSSKFYIYTSFLETLVQRNRTKVVKKIIDQIEYSSCSNKLIAVLNNLFGEKSMHFAVTNPEMIELLKEHGIQPPNSKRNSGAVQSAFSLGVDDREPIEEAISMRSELGGIPKRWSGVSANEIS